ncbi:OsmC family protein [Nesterenkonia salmonea]|uniref:OsmC family protein n=1 Tax=Nesterenkonia salmonea TaxID=1804987 RepID=A0A5R9B8W6_9MICC|nr:OsmC family protein [Nesterenkonia salmonea]TLP92378.1 OsmC family protein [Nesterenkonia salmonea]
MTAETTTSHLEGIDAAALDKLSCAAKDDPSTGRKTLKAKTVCEAGFRNMNYVRDLEPVLISEPSQLLGDNSAPNPTEMALGALGSCISVGLLANATARGVTLSKIEVNLEGDIDISAVWGTGDLDTEKALGVTDVRVNIVMDGDADEATLEEIHQSAMDWSPVVNTFKRPVQFESELTVG